MLEKKIDANISPKQTNKITIILADDHPLLRQALRTVLETQPDFEVIAEASDGEEAIQKTAELLPDVVIMDISMPKINGLEATRQINTKYPKTAILVLTVYDDNEHILTILQSGASGYLTKTVFGDEVIQAVRAVVAGDNVLSPLVMQNLLKHSLKFTSKSVSLKAKDKITSREMDVLRLAARGLSNGDIAVRLDLTIRTVKSYLEQIFSKLNTTNRTETVISALRVGILTSDDIE